PATYRALLLVGAHVEEDLVEVQLAEVGAPLRAALLLGDLERAQAELQHPLRLALEVADLLDDALRQAALGLVEVLLRQPEVVLIGVLHPLELGRVGVKFFQVGHASLHLDRPPALRRLPSREPTRSP